MDGFVGDSYYYRQLVHDAFDLALEIKRHSISICEHPMLVNYFLTVANNELTYGWTRSPWLQGVTGVAINLSFAICTPFH